MRKNKILFFAGMGAAGGAAGSFLAEMVPDLGKTPTALVIFTACWFAVISVPICFALFWAIESYSRRPGFPSQHIKTAVMAGVIAGAIGGGVAQAVYNQEMDPFLKLYVLRTFCWAIAGGLAAWRLAKVVPNLRGSKAILGGAIGGAVGCLGFLMVASQASDTMARLLGMAIYGAALGLCLVVVEMAFREASLDVIWAPNEVTTFSLGPRPITIGGGDDHIFVHGLPQHAASVTFDAGKIAFNDHTQSKTTELRDGSRVNVGKLTLVVKAKAASGATQVLP